MDRRWAIARGAEIPTVSSGSLLSADVSGFTPLTEALVDGLGARRGAEELTKILNAVYTSLVARVHHFGGSVVCFIGDALIGWFPDDAGARAAACGLQMQRAMGQFRAMASPQGGRVSLAMKAAVAAGPVRRFLVGDPAIQRLDVLAGATVDRLTEAGYAAERGDVIVAPEVVQRCAGNLIVETWRGRHGAAEGFRETVQTAPWPDPTDDGLDAGVLRPYVLPPVHARITGGSGDFLAELRPVSVLFLRFDGIDYDGDASAGAKLDAYTAWVQGIAARHGGYVLLLTTADKGSHLYVVFGALEAHEDEPVRAVATAEALLTPPSDLDFITGVQIGVSHGRARVGAYGGATRRTYGAIGDAVNLAARLMEAAPVGEIRCDERIVAGARGAWAFDALPAIELKGMRDPQPVHRPRGRTRGARSTATSSLVGRQAECERIERALAEVAEGERRVLLIEGEAGIGKSRLVDEVRRLAVEAGAAWRFGAAHAIERQTPYRAWRELIEAELGVDDLFEPAARRMRVLRAIEALDPTYVDRAPLLNDIVPLGLPETDLTRSYDPQLRQEGLATLVGDLLLARSRAQPLVLAIDDVHWMDSLSWDLALSVVRTLFRSPVLLLLTHRPLAEPVPGPHRILCDLEETTILRLGSLPAEETVALAAAALGLRQEGLPPEVGELLRERSEGNPFFALELVQALRDREILCVEDGACTVSGDARALRESVPDTLEGVVLSRLDLLPPDGQLTLRAASVIGRSFLLRTLAAVTPDGAEPEALRIRLDETGRRRLTVLEAEDPELSYAFQHAVTQHVAYDTLLYEQRRTLHRSVAGWIEAEHAADLGAQAPLLVVHWNRAGHEENECRYSLLAGARAAGQSANVEAFGYFDRAIELIERLDRGRSSERRFDALRARAKVLAVLGRVEEERADLEALRTAVGTDEDGRASAVDLLWSDFHRRGGRFADAIEEAERALGRLHAHQDRAGEARALTCIGSSLEGLGRFADARERIEQAVAIYRATEGLDGLAGEAVRALGIIAARLGEFPQAMERFGEAHELFRRAGDRKGEAEILGNLGAVSYYFGEYERSIESSEKAQQAFRELGHRAGLAKCLMNTGSAYCDLGAFERAPAYFEQALELYRQLDDANELAGTTFNLGMALHALSVAGYPNVAVDDRYDPAVLDDALDRYGDALRSFEKIGNRRGEALANYKLGTGQLTRGNTDGAEAYLRTALELCREMEWGSLEVTCLSAIARVRLHAGDVDGAVVRSSEAIDRLGDGAPPDTNELCFTHYRVLEAAGQGEEAKAYLARSQAAVTELAASIRDKALKDAFFSACRPILDASR